MRFSRRRLKRARPLLGTFVEIDASADVEEGALNAWITAGFAAVAQVERLMSFHRDDSDLTRLNRAAPREWVDIHPFTAQVLRASNRLHVDSGGVFDIRCGALLVRNGTFSSPAGSGLRSRWKGRGPAVELRGTQARKTGRWVLDLGGIAKGFAVDRAVEAICRVAAGRDHSGVVNAGGDLRVWGTSASAAIHWGARLAPINLRQCAAATSAARPGGRNGRLLTVAEHVVMPAGVSCRRPETVTVFADLCIFADALTKVVLLGSEAMASGCLSAHRAKAVIFSADGVVGKALG